MVSAKIFNKNIDEKSDLENCGVIKDLRDFKGR